MWGSGSDLGGFLGPPPTQERRRGRSFRRVEVGDEVIGRCSPAHERARLRREMYFTPKTRPGLAGPMCRRSTIGWRGDPVALATTTDSLHPAVNRWKSRPSACHATVYYGGRTSTKAGCADAAANFLFGGYQLHVLCSSSTNRNSDIRSPSSPARTLLSRARAARSALKSERIARRGRDRCRAKALAGWRVMFPSAWRVSARVG